MFFQTVFTSLLVIMLGLALLLYGLPVLHDPDLDLGLFAGFQFGATIFT